MSLSEDRLAQKWSNDRRSARIYDLTIQRQSVYRLESRIVWGTDARAFYADLDALKDLPEGMSVLDVPCGGGVAFRGLKPDMQIRYVAADVSPIMLERAKAKAARRGLTNIEYVRTRVERMPFEDATFDLCLNYNGLHCFSDPQAAVAEMARVLRPRGQLRGTAVVTGGGALSAKAIAFFRRREQFGDVVSAEDIERRLTDAGFEELRLDRRGAYLFFEGRRAATGER